ncbi:MAG: TIM barrel protein [Pirellulales bacterium]|nr:TIM barrel protein [Pirellulales bacterium]
MVKIAVCLETVFTDLPVAERIAAIAQLGFRDLEFWHPEGTFDGKTVRFDLAKDPAELKDCCRKHGVAINDFAMHAWDGSIGGSPVKAADRAKYLEQIARMIAFGKSIGCTRGITLSGVVDPALSRTQMRENLERALGEAAEMAGKADFTLLLEPLNTLVDHPGYYLDSSTEAAEIVRGIGNPYLKMLYDVYHNQIMEGNVLATIERNIDIIGHFHSAGVPGRGELFDGELNYPAIVKRIEALGYRGCFGLEYFPRMADSRASLAAIRRYLGE